LPANTKAIATPRRTIEKATTIPVVRKAIDVTNAERFAAIGLLAFGALPLVVSWVRLLTSVFNLAEWTNLTILGLYSFVLIETVSLILLRGLRRIDLSDAAMRWIGCMALAEIVPLVW
jgi:hypothetical protein